MGLENTEPDDNPVGKPPHRSPRSSMKNTLAASALAVLALAGCGDGKQKLPNGFQVSQRAIACANDKSIFPDISASCKDPITLESDLLSKCELPNGDAIVKMGGEPYTVNARIKSAIDEICR